MTRGEFERRQVERMLAEAKAEAALELVRRGIWPGRAALSALEEGKK